MLGCLYSHGLEAGAHRVVSDSIQKNRLPDPTQPDHQHAFCRPTRANALDRDSYLLSQFVATSEFRRGSTRAWSVWILYGIHVRNIPKLVILSIYDKITNLDQISSTRSGCE